MANDEKYKRLKQAQKELKELDSKVRAGVITFGGIKESISLIRYDIDKYLGYTLD